MNYYVKKKIRPALSYYGGKFVLCQRILETAPLHTIYVEPFAGGLNVLLNKYRSDVEVVCDISPELIKFYHVLVENCDELIERVRGIKCEKASLLAARAVGDKGDDLTRAVNFLCRQRMCYSGSGGWAKDKKKVAAWGTLPYDLEDVAKRLAGVQIFCRSALDVIPEYDSPDTFFYCDPPYYSETRNSQGDYLHELPGLDHLRLLRLLNTLQGNVILSGYDHLMYSKELAHWNRVEIEVEVNSSNNPNGRLKQTEILWVKS